MLLARTPHNPLSESLEPLMNALRNLFVILFLCSFAAASLAGPPRAQGQSHEIRVQTDLVQVPVIVHRAGKHVTGLKKEDFTVTADGKDQAIDVFEEVHTELPAKASVAGEFTNIAASGGGVAQRLTIIAIDLENTAPLDQAYLKQEVVKFLDTAANTGEPFALVALTLGGIHVLHDFTTDPKILAAVVKGQPIQNAAREAAGGTVMDITPCAASTTGCGGDANADRGMRQWADWKTMMTNQEGFEIYRDNATRVHGLLALQQLAQALRGLPGRKTLIWASSGIEILGGISRMFRGMSDARGGASIYSGTAGGALDQNAYTFSLLNSANIAVYPLDARHGSNTSFADFDTKHSDAPLSQSLEVTRASNLEVIDMFQTLAAATGGKPCFNRTDLATCLKEAAEDSHDFYMLGFYADKKLKPGWHSIGVKLAGPRAELHYRDGFLTGAFDPESSKLTDLQLAMLSPIDYTAVPFRGHFETPVDKGGKKEVGFALDLPPGAVVPDGADRRLALDIAVIARGQGGKEAAKFAQRIERKLTAEQAAVIKDKGIHYTNKFEVSPGEYGIWFVVRDSVRGQTGSAVTTLSVK
jgi:VWFA-related protein